jgi:hypothetical protein
MIKRLFFGLVFSCALTAAGYLGAQQDPPLPGGRDVSCRECGVITSIRELQQERADARTITQRLPPVGPVFGFTFGDGPTKGFVGAIGNQEMRDRLTEISYEVIVRYNDGRYGVVETRYGADLRVGDRVKVDRNKIDLDFS